MKTELRLLSACQPYGSGKVIDVTTCRHTTRVLLLGATLLASTTLLSSLAEAAGLECVSSLPSSSCRLTLLPGLTLESTLANTIETDSNEYQLTGTVTVVTPSIRIPLNNTSMTARLGPAPELYGETEVPLGSMPMLQNATFHTVPRAVIGLAQSTTIEELVNEPLPLNTAKSMRGTERSENKPYLLFHLNAGLEFSLNMKEQLELLNEIKFKAPGSLTREYRVLRVG